MIIIHGDNQPESRNRFLEIKKQKQAAGNQIVDMTGPGLILSELKNKAESASLLGNANSLFITDLFSGRPGREKNIISDYLLANTRSDINIWEAKDVSAQLKKFPVELIVKYELPRYIFRFLDHPDMPLLRQSLAGSAPEQIFSLLVSHFRKLIIVKSHAGDYPSWQLAKLARQAEAYSPEKLAELYRELLNIDYRQKTSATSHNLSFSLELWVNRL